MGTYVSLLRFDSPEADADHPKAQNAGIMLEGYIEAHEKLGLEIRATYLTFGSHDALVIMEAAGDAEVARLIAGGIGMRPMIRAKILRAFSREQYKAYLLPS